MLPERGQFRGLVCTSDRFRIFGPWASKRAEEANASDPIRFARRERVPVSETFALEGGSSSYDRSHRCTRSPRGRLSRRLIAQNTAAGPRQTELLGRSFPLGEVVGKHRKCCVATGSRGVDARGYLNIE